MEQQRIVCAAIADGEEHVICSVRHFDLRMHAQIADSKHFWGRAVQGFIDNRGEFLTREQAFKVAMEAGQIIDRCGGDEGKLFSENLY